MTLSFRTITIFNTFLAILSLVALALAVGLVIYRVVKGKEGVAHLRVPALWLAWTVAAVATAGSLIFSEVIGYNPCRLCWFQRIAMYPMSVILLIGAWRKDMAVKLYALPFAIVGLGISIWHYVIQNFPNLDGGSCDAAAPCTFMEFQIFGFITIPFMAGAGFTLIAVLLALYVKAPKK